MTAAAVSIVIPVLDEAPVIAVLLGQLRERLPRAELIVVDGGSADASAELARPLCDHLLHSPAGRARQMNAGAMAARGEYLFFLHADCLPGIDWPALERYLAGFPAWGFCRVRLEGEEWRFRLIGACMNWRSRATAVATGDQMLFLRRDLWQSVGGYADLPLMEDVDLCKRLRRLAPPLVIREPVRISSRRWRRRGTLRTVFEMWALRLAWVCGVPAGRLWQVYYGRHPGG